MEFNVESNKQNDNNLGKNNALKTILSWKTLPILLVLLGMCLVLSIISPTFRTSDNFFNILQQSAINAILAFGVTFVILVSGTDLSLGSVLAFSGMTMAMIIPTVGVPGSIAVAILIGAAFGAFNGFLVAYVGLAPFIVTMGTMSIGRGLTLVISNSSPVSGLPDSLRELARGKLFGVLPIPVIIMLIIFLISFILLRYTRFGRSLYAIGGNEEATRLSGINVKIAKLGAFVWAGGMAGLAGVIQSARLNSAQPTAGVSYEMDAIAAAVIGGASLSGGVASPFGTLLGALIIGVLRNGLNLMSVSTNWQQVVIGVVVIGAAALDTLKQGKKD